MYYWAGQPRLGSRSVISIQGLESESVKKKFRYFPIPIPTVLPTYTGRRIIAFR